jgi:hypothetical protein
VEDAVHAAGGRAFQCHTSAIVEGHAQHQLVFGETPARDAGHDTFDRHVVAVSSAVRAGIVSVDGPFKAAAALVITGLDGEVAIITDHAEVHTANVVTRRDVETKSSIAAVESLALIVGIGGVVQRVVKLLHEGRKIGFVRGGRKLPIDVDAVIAPVAHEGH